MKAIVRYRSAGRVQEKELEGDRILVEGKNDALTVVSAGPAGRTGGLEGVRRRIYVLTSSIESIDLVEESK